MPERGPKKPFSEPEAPGPGESTDRHSALPRTPGSTLTDEEPPPTDVPTMVPRNNPGKKGPNGEWPTVLDEPPAVAQASKSKLPAVGRKSTRGELPVVQVSKSGLPKVADRPPSKTNLPQVGERPPSKTNLPQVKARLSKQIPAVQDPEVGKKTEMRPGLGDQTLEVKTDARPLLDDQTVRPKLTESPTTLRPSLGQENAPTGPQKPIHELGTQPGLRAGGAVEVDTDRTRRPEGDTGPNPIGELTTDKKRALTAEPLRDDPAVSTMGYRSLRAQRKEPLLDKQTRLYLAAAVAGTFVVGAILWKLAGPTPPPPDPSLPRTLPKALVDAARPAPPPDKPVAPEVKKDDNIYLTEEVDAGFGKLKTVKIPAGTIQILSDPDVTITRKDGAELGRTPITITLPVGTNALVVTNKEQGLTRNMNLEVEPGVNSGVRWSFSRGRIEVRAPAGTRVTIDGRFVGKTPLSPTALWPGNHTVEVAFPKGGTDKRRIDVEAGVTQATDFEAPVYDSRLAE